MAAIGAPAAMRVGGKTASGPPKGIYAVEVKDAITDVSKNKGTPFIQLDLWVKGDSHNPDREGKRLVKQAFYGPHPEKSEEEQEQAKGRLLRSLYKPLQLPWPKSEGGIDTRIFVGKKFFVLLAPESNPQDPNDPRMEVRRISMKREDLEKALANSVAKESEVTGDKKPAKSKPAR